MAESVFTELVRRAGREAEFVIDSAATSTEEIGNSPHRAPLPSCVKSGFPSSHIVHVRCVAQSMATGTTLSIWTTRTPAPCTEFWEGPRWQDLAPARLDRSPRRRGRPLVHRQFRRHLPRCTRRLHRHARAAVGARAARAHGPRHRHKNECGFSPTLSVRVRSKREKIHARYLGGRKSTLMNVTKGLPLCHIRDWP